MSAATDPPSRPHRPLWLRLLPLALVLTALIAALASGAVDNLSLATLREHRETLRATVQAHPLLSLLAFAALYAVVTGLSIPGAVFLTLSGGFLFGVVQGTAATTVGATIGATVIFLVVRLAAGDAVRRWVGRRAARFEAGFRRDAFFYLLSLRLAPVAPFWLVNLIAPLLGTPLRTFVVATFLGVIPVVAIYSSVGASLDRWFASGREPGLDLLLEPQLIASLVGLALLSLAPVAWRAWSRRRGGDKVRGLT